MARLKVHAGNAPRSAHGCIRSNRKHAGCMCSVEDVIPAQTLLGG